MRYSWFMHATGLVGLISTVAVTVTVTVGLQPFAKTAHPAVLVWLPTGLIALSLGCSANTIFAGSSKRALNPNWGVTH